MNKRIISTALSLAVAVSAFGSFSVTASAEAKTPQYQEKARQLEQLNRGLIAVKTADGVYLSWRIFGTESLAKQEFDIYRNGTYIYTIEGGEATSWTDPSGTENDTYQVITTGEDLSKAEAVKPTTNTQYNYSYMDVPVEMPENSLYRRIELTDKNGKYAGTGGGINDASVGDLDGDGDYEIVLKWDPSNSKDAASGGTTGRVYLDGYEISEDNTNSDGNGHLYKWRIDLGPHVRAGAHETPFLVYDFDGDGRAEIVSLTGPGAVDGTGKYVTEVGDTEEIRNADNSKITTSNGKNIGPEYYTLFDGETGKALWTTEAIPIGRTDGKDWGKNTLNESQRYLAAVAYLDGVHPSFVMCRGYYYRSALRAYSWDGSELTRVGEYDAQSGGIDSLYGQGNHNLSVGDIDNDGKDEIVYGSACLDDDLRTVMGNTQLGHGDAMHLNDFNNDGIQEVFSVKEKSGGFKKYAEDLRVASTGQHFWEEYKLVTSDDNGRGIMDNMDDEYAKANPNALAIGWSSGFANAHDLNGNDIGPKAGTAARGGNTNFLIYWDDDLGRELLDTTIICKYHAPGGNIDRLATFEGVNANNSTKYNPTLVADLWGDWREEVIFAANDTQAAIDEGKQPAMRIFTSNIPTQYRIPTLMHDSQYRLAIAWQNIAYNQPPHTSYYIGSAALATDNSGNELNYLAPAVPYTKVTYDAPAQVAVTGVEIANKEITVEKGKSVSIGASVIPADATKKGLSYTSSDESVAKASNGAVTGVSAGTAEITVTTKDGGFTDTCTVTVFEKPVTGVALSEKVVELGVGNTAKLTANVYPDEASDKTVKWSSEDTSVATVDGSGVITGVGFGKTNVTATAGGVTAKCIVKVKPMNIVDATGTDDFVISNADGDKVKFTGTSNSAVLTLNEATSFVEFHKDFEAIDKNTAALSFRFTTGGAKTTDYIWKLGHEYNTELKFLDTSGNQIFDIIEQHTTSGVTTYYSVGGGGWQQASNWKKVSGDADNPWNRSQIRWDVKVTFDYASDTGTINLAGCNSSWERGATYETTFPLNGASFKTLKYETNTIKDWVSGNPKLEQLSYTSTEQVSGNTDVIYEKGTDKAEWAETDLTDWTQTGTDTAALAFDAENGRVLYNPVKPAGEYSAEKTFDVTPGAVVSYDVDWYFGKAVARDGNYEYLQFGDKLRLGWTNGYKLMLSTDGGATYGTDVFTGSNTDYTKNVKAQFNTSEKTVTLSFDGKQIYSGVYSDADSNTADGANLVKFGFTRGGASPDWDVPNGIARIRAAQFIEGEEEPDFSAVKITGTDGNTVNLAYDLVDYNGGSVQFIGALYDASGKLAELKANEVTELDTSVQHIRQGTDSITFTNDVTGGTVKVFMWNSLDSMVPIGDCASK